jgi:indolepyruvate ferredoxin oxidoreductase
VEQLLARLDAGNHALALDIARLPEQIKGYGHVKARHLATVRPKWAELMRQWSEARVGPRELQAA